MAAAVSGRGVFYYVTMVAVLMVLCLSANTSFADFPRVCRLLALDEFLPSEFAHRGRRLVYSQGIIVLALLAGMLLVVFGGITDRGLKKSGRQCFFRWISALMAAAPEASVHGHRAKSRSCQALWMTRRMSPKRLTYD
ncbi:exported hypothetical protein [Verrucomicrobia bacterium]|nr:exported hypothetical protein [Verrucomicrobiota bacterium]